MTSRPDLAATGKWSPYDSLIERAFVEDLGEIGDITTNAIIDASQRARFNIVAREVGVVAGLEVAKRAFAIYNSAIEVDLKLADGDLVSPGDIIATLSGSARSIITCERTALNFIGHLSGIATLTRKFVDQVKGTNAKIADTRKTTPGLRALEKAAVKAGGGSNHRFNLSDAVMIKDNHIAVAGGITKAVELVRQSVGHLVKIEVEVDNLDQLSELLAVGADVVLLDNMDAATLSVAVKMVNGAMITEASGGINLATVREKALSGVDLLSVGALTHSAVNLDIGLDEVKL